MTAALEILAVLALVAANAYFVIGEYAVVTARRGPLMRRAEEGSRGAAAALKLMDEPVRVISTVQVGITAVGILIGALGEPLVRGLLGDAIPTWLAFVIAFSVVTYLSVVLGELVPKALTLDRAETLAVLIAPSITLMAVVVRPVVLVFERSAGVLLRPFGISEVVAGGGVATPEELRQLVDDAEDSGVIETAQEELLHNVFDFASAEARDILVPADDLVWLDAALLPDAAFAEALRTGHSRFPVGDGSLDRITGVIHLRDLARAAQSGEQTPVQQLGREVHVIPPTKDLAALLRELRQRHEQLAIVADEYGRTLGIVTVEDILEELVGEIEDEYDLPDASVERLPDGRVRVAGTLTVDDFNEAFDTKLPEGDAHTLAGIVFTALGRLPRKGEQVTAAHVTFEVDELDGARIRRLIVSLPRP
ncbi:MAG: HlyC/CorC family transporter [Solirubrobacteraceae bacterium]|nr:HlyC/CorC family transporter [Solirubrobacteraceae bacterium]